MSTKRWAGFATLLVTVALVAVPATALSAPHWEKNNVVIGSAHVTVTSKASLAFTIASTGVLKCQLNDSEEIWNPTSGGAGEDLFTAFGPGACKGKTTLCTSPSYTFAPTGLGWTSLLVGSAPVRDEFAMSFTLECNSAPVDVITGTLKPEVANGQLRFNAASGNLTDFFTNTVTVSGSDKLKAPPGKIKAT